MIRRFGSKNNMTFAFVGTPVARALQLSTRSPSTRTKTGAWVLVTFDSVEANKALEVWVIIQASKAYLGGLHVAPKRSLLQQHSCAGGSQPALTL